MVRKVIAEQREEPGASSGPHSDAPPRSPSGLNRGEQAVYDQLLDTAKQLHKRRVVGVYGIVADVAEKAAVLKSQEQDALPALARGLDHLALLAAQQRQLRWQRFKVAASDYDIGSYYYLLFLFALAAGGGALAGFPAVGAFFAIGVPACAIAIVWTMLTKL